MPDSRCSRVGAPGGKVSFTLLSAGHAGMACVVLRKQGDGIFSLADIVGYLESKGSITPLVPSYLFAVYVHCRVIVDSTEVNEHAPVKAFFFYFKASFVPCSEYKIPMFNSRQLAFGAEGHCDF